MFQWTFGIKLWENGAFQEGNEVHSNVVFDNGRGQAGDYQGRGVGIWLDGVPGNPGNLNVVRHNLVHNNRGNGIFIEISGNTLVLGNVLYDNASVSGGVNEFAPANIAAPLTTTSSRTTSSSGQASTTSWHSSAATTRACAAPETAMSSTTSAKGTRASSDGAASTTPRTMPGRPPTAFQPIRFPATHGSQGHLPPLST
jgi:parallel beta-helix repeat protein